MCENNSALQMNWDLRSYFQEFNGEEMKDFKNQLKAGINELQRKAAEIQELQPANVENFAEVISGYEELVRKFSHLRSYVACLSSVDSGNQQYAREESEISVTGSSMEKIELEILRVLKNAGNEETALLKDHRKLEGCGYYIDRLHAESGNRMTREKEILSSDLSVDGISSWGRLYNTMSGKLSFRMEYPDGRTETVPMSYRRSLMEHPERKVRKAAFEGGNESWKAVDYVAAAALNSIAGTRLTLNRHRGIEHFLDVALFQSAISRDTLDAMFEAIYSNLSIPRDILSIKSDIMGTPGIAWYDLGAEIEFGNRQRIDWENAKEIIQRSFDSSYPSLGSFFSKLCVNNWIEWEPRDGKRPGGFCTTSLLTNESRIFMTYNGGIGDVLTLAHETGHAYHSSLLSDLRPFQRSYPMTLAECASTFAELLLTDGMMNSGEISIDEKKYILNTDLDHAAIFLLDIPVRYEFEKKFYEERSDGQVSVDRLYELMTQTQKNIFGDILIDEDPCFWISKLHFYITGLTFYNYPYTFGYLLSRLLYERYLEQGNSFLPDYEKLLKMSGSGDCETVIRESIGEDCTRTEFWSRAITGIRRSINDFRSLVEERDSCP